MLQKLMAMPKAKLSALVQSIDEKAVKGRAMRRQLSAMKRKEGGFTLLELLVVVAILAAIAGTAATMLHDTDRKANAAAHVAMMDGLSKGIANFHKLNADQYPDNWDSLLSSSTGLLGGTTALSVTLSSDLAANLIKSDFTSAELAALDAVGIKTLRVLDETKQVDGALACVNATSGAGNIVDTIKSKANDITPQNIFRNVNGCGAAPIAAATATQALNGSSIISTATAGVYTQAGQLVRWAVGQNGRVNAGAADKLLAVGAGSDATLFNPSNYGALTNTPIYRHVASGEYNRFIVLFNVTSDSTKPTNGKATLQAIIDGAGDTKDEELGEFDNVRPT